MLCAVPPRSRSSQAVLPNVKISGYDEVCFVVPQAALQNLTSRYLKPVILMPPGFLWVAASFRSAAVELKMETMSYSTSRRVFGLQKQPCHWIE